MDKTKRELREEKRVIKRAGHKHRRQRLRKALAVEPEEAAHLDDDFGRHRSSSLNGLDRDSTRRRFGKLS